MKADMVNLDNVTFNKPSETEHGYTERHQGKSYIIFADMDKFIRKFFYCRDLTGFWNRPI